MNECMLSVCHVCPALPPPASGRLALDAKGNALKLKSKAHTQPHSHHGNKLSGRRGREERAITSYHHSHHHRRRRRRLLSHEARRRRQLQALRPTSLIEGVRQARHCMLWRRWGWGSSILLLLLNHDHDHADG